jgi:hypothetical protein
MLPNQSVRAYKKKENKMTTKKVKTTKRTGKELEKFTCDFLGFTNPEVFRKIKDKTVLCPICNKPQLDLKELAYQSALFNQEIEEDLNKIFITLKGHINSLLDNYQEVATKHFKSVIREYFFEYGVNNAEGFPPEKTTKKKMPAKKQSAKIKKGKVK